MKRKINKLVVYDYEDMKDVIPFDDWVIEGKNNRETLSEVDIIRDAYKRLFRILYKKKVGINLQHQEWK